MTACPLGLEDRTGAVIFFACLDIEQKSSFVDGHELTFNRAIMMPMNMGC
jgi:hypothetical protein